MCSMQACMAFVVCLETRGHGDIECDKLSGSRPNLSAARYKMIEGSHTSANELCR